jgi:hypothetical protein
MPWQKSIVVYIRMAIQQWRLCITINRTFASLDVWHAQKEKRRHPLLSYSLLFSSSILLVDLHRLKSSGGGLFPRGMHICQFNTLSTLNVNQTIQHLKLVPSLPSYTQTWSL